MVEALIVLVVVIVLVAMSLKIVREDHRLFVLRLGRATGIRAPGIVFVLPLIDRGIDVDLERAVPGWRGLEGGDLESRIVAAFERGEVL